LPGITPVGFAPVPRLLRNQGRGDDPADGAFFEQVALEPGAAGTGFVDEDKLLALGLQLSDELVASTLPSPDSAKGDDVCTLFLGHVGDRDRVFMAIHSDVERA